MEPDDWLKPQVAVFVSVLAVLVGFVIYATYVGRLPGSPYAGMYAFLKDPSWLNFRRAYGDLVADAWGNMLLTFVFLSVPVPKVPTLVFLELLMLKTALYNLTVALFAGKPVYVPSAKLDVTDKVGTWSSVGVAVVIVLATHLVINMQRMRRDQRAKDAFEARLTTLLGLN
jgi:hypothetical protein